jgi:hypothetical protein
MNHHLRGQTTRGTSISQTFYHEKLIK